MPAYIALLHKDAGSQYGVSFPDLPGCVSAGTDWKEARVMAEEALRLHLRGMAEDGEALPEASSFESIMSDPGNRDGAALLVETPPTGDQSRSAA